jgi:hypothetical protein
MTWRVKRIDTQGEHGGLECGDPDTSPLTITLEDPATGGTSTLNVCWITDPSRYCENLANLAIAGFVPNDWTVECPGEVLP